MNFFQTSQVASYLCYQIFFFSKCCRLGPKCLQGLKFGTRKEKTHPYENQWKKQKNIIYRSGNIKKKICRFAVPFLKVGNLHTEKSLLKKFDFFKVSPFGPKMSVGSEIQNTNRETSHLPKLVKKPKKYSIQKRQYLKENLLVCLYVSNGRQPAYQKNLKALLLHVLPGCLYWIF